MVVAGHIAPLSLVMPHHDHTVLPRKEVAVRLPRVPVFIKLGSGSGGGGEKHKTRKHKEECPKRTERGTWGTPGYGRPGVWWLEQTGRGNKRTGTFQEGDKSQRGEQHKERVQGNDGDKGGQKSRKRQ